MITSMSLPLADALSLGCFEPARVQRQYQWRTEHVSELLDDLLGAFQSFGADPGQPEPDENDEDDDAGAEEDAAVLASLPVEEEGRRGRRIALQARTRPDLYFLGAMIFYKSSTGRTLFVYDGLQRLTTLNILLAQLRDGWPARTADDDATIRTCLFEGERQRLGFTSLGRVLNPMIAGRAVPMSVERTESEERVREAALLLRRSFEGWSDERRRSFLGFLLSQIYLVVTEVDNLTVAYQMFNGANARGLQLGAADVLKGLFAEQIRLGGGKMADVDQFAKIWRDASNTLRRGFDPFLHSIEVLRFRLEERHNTGQHLEALFSDGTPAADILKWFEGDFLELFNAGKKARAHFSLETAEGADIALRQLSFLGWNDWQPLYLAIALAHNGRYETAQFAAEMRALARACYIIELFDMPEKARRRKFLDAIAMREKGGNPFAKKGKQRGPLWFGSRSVKTNLRLRLRSPLLSNQKRGAIVRWIETLQWGKSLPRNITNDTNVEHVLPVTAREGWTELFTPEEIEEQTHRLGNLCLLGKADNEEAGNKQLAAKIEIFKRRSPQTKGPDLVLVEIEKQQAAGRKAWSAIAIDELTEHFAAIAQRELGI